ncbi:Beta-1,3-galactosyl-O-glycosyl-glycoprotein beta-1,6-N-acetylglucosaminyltransferase 3 [Schistosoma japonicum]|nr:Beta-1,3-galactosyl-O-glycosyl-glycoprotein beta-1,6-N-acetylglucosaminyltransferase 3 [Schistosoma japonicum]
MLSYVYKNSRRYFVIRKWQSLFIDNALGILFTSTIILLLVIIILNTGWHNHSTKISNTKQHHVPTPPYYQNIINKSMEICERFLKYPVTNKSISKQFATYSTHKDRYRLWNGTTSCYNFKELIEQPVWLSEEEKSFPIAYSLLIYENIEWTARLLRLIYRPNNLYCIHVDKKSPNWFYEEIIQLSKCYGDNVHVISRLKSVPIFWGHYPVVDGFLKCAEMLLNNQVVNWQYLLNINGKELPLRTNWELVVALKALNMSNVIDCSRKKAPKNRYPVKLPSFPVNWTKGSFHAALRRDMVNYILHDKRALELRGLFKEEEDLLKVPDEMFFSTLAYNPQLQAPGACHKCYATNQKDPRSTFVARYKIWWPAHCASKRIVRQICIFGIQHLHAFTQRTEFFANKFNPGFHEFAYDCLEYWILKKMKNERVTGKLDTGTSMYLTLKLLHILSLITYNCLIDSTLINNRNYVLLTNQITFCEANKMCHEYGLSVDKYFSLPIISDLQYLSDDLNVSTFWMEYNALFTYRTDKSIKWRYYNTTNVADLSGLQLENIPLSGHILKGVLCSSINYALCIEVNVNQSLNTNLSISLRKYSFHMVDIPNLLSMNETTDGCYEVLWSNNKHHCIFLCSMILHCLSAYFNQIEKLCIVILYQQSLLPNKYSFVNTQWIRFALN